MLQHHLAFEVNEVAGPGSGDTGSAMYRRSLQVEWPDSMFTCRHSIKVFFSHMFVFRHLVNTFCWKFLIFLRDVDFALPFVQETTKVFTLGWLYPVTFASFDRRGVSSGLPKLFKFCLWQSLYVENHCFISPRPDDSASNESFFSARGKFFWPRDKWLCDRRIVLRRERLFLRRRWLFRSCDT